MQNKHNKERRREKRATLKACALLSAGEEGRRVWKKSRKSQFGLFLFSNSS